MTYKKLQSKTAKQLRTFLYNNGWTRSDITSFLKEELPTNMTDECLKVSLAVIDTWSFENILKIYHDEVVDFIWEELTSA